MSRRPESHLYETSIGEKRIITQNILKSVFIIVLKPKQDFYFWSILKEISPGISLEGMMLKLKLQYFKEKAMAPHSSTLAWRIPGVAEPGGLPSMGSHRVGHD